jgi:hypothetical protein
MYYKRPYEEILFNDIHKYLAQNDLTQILPKIVLNRGETWQGSYLQVSLTRFIYTI